MSAITPQMSDLIYRRKRSSRTFKVPWHGYHYLLLYGLYGAVFSLVTYSSVLFRPPSSAVSRLSQGHQLHSPTAPMESSVLNALQDTGCRCYIRHPSFFNMELSVGSDPNDTKINGVPGKTLHPLFSIFQPQPLTLRHRLLILLRAAGC